MRGPIERCACCGGPLPGGGLTWRSPILIGSRLSIELAGAQARLFDALWRERGNRGLSRDQLMNALYFDRADGGPLHDNIVAVCATALRPKVAPFGLEIRAGRGRGATMRLLRRGQA